MTPTVSLPMYNLPEMRADNARFWEALRELLVEAGLRDVPERLTFDRLPVPERIGPEVFFSQTCGYPLETIFSGQAIRLGTPCYAVPGCDGPTHCGLFIVPAGSAARELRDLRGGVFLFNNRHSNSGMNLTRRALADIADGRPFFAKVIETGSHPDNLDRIARSEADATAVDNVTYAFWRHYRPEAARGVGGGRPGQCGCRSAFSLIRMGRRGPARDWTRAETHSRTSEPIVRRLTAGGEWIRTFSSAPDGQRFRSFVPDRPDRLSAQGSHPSSCWLRRIPRLKAVGQTPAYPHFRQGRW